jgi:hypothetical protein
MLCDFFPLFFLWDLCFSGTPVAALIRRPSAAFYFSSVWVVMGEDSCLSNVKDALESLKISHCLLQSDCLDLSATQITWLIVMET